MWIQYSLPVVTFKKKETLFPQYDIIILYTYKWFD